MSDEQIPENIKKRNRVLGLTLFIFAVALMVVSYYKIDVVTP